jgi:predicted nucleic acid-binding Zn ribbon protein
MESLLKTLPAILEVAGDSPEVVEAACMAAFKYAAGEGLRDHAVPLNLNNDTLVIGVADSTWQQQLQSLNSQLLSRINSILGKPLVNRLEFRVAPEQLPNISEPRR